MALKRAKPAKVELVDCTPDPDCPRKVLQVVINGVPVMITNQPPKVHVPHPDEPRAVEVSLTLMVSELVVRAATDDDMQVDMPQEGAWEYTMPPRDDE